MQLVQRNEKVKTDDKFSFHNKSIAQRSTILFAGPVANFIFFFFSFYQLLFWFYVTKPIIELNK